MKKKALIVGDMHVRNECKGLWSQLEVSNNKTYGQTTTLDIAKAMKDMTDRWEMDRIVKTLKSKVEARFKGEQLERVNQLIDSRDSKNHKLVEGLIETTEPYKPVERERSPMHIYTGTKGAELINKAIQDEVRKFID